MRYLSLLLLLTSVALGQTQATLSAPVPGSVLSASQTFTWTAGTGVSAYGLHVGTTPGGMDIYQSGALQSTSLTLSLPTNGTPIYVGLYSLINGSWQSTWYSFTEGSALANLVSPTPGSTLPGSTVTFSWTAGSGVSAYGLHLGSTQGGSDIYRSGSLSGTSVTVANLPVDGSAVYALLYSQIDGAWHNIPYSFIAAQSHSVDLSWDASSGTDPAVGYNAYRQVGCSGTYTLLNSSPIGALSFTDANVVSGSSYGYMVTAVDSQGIESQPSNSICEAIP